MAQRPPIYLDYHAHARIDPRVAQTLADATIEFDANPHSSHWHGDRARKAVDLARQQVAGLIGVQPSEVIFTSGATEANNLALKGFTPNPSENGVARTLVSAGEHPSVLAPADSLCGGEAERIALQPSGQVDLGSLERALARPTSMVSIAAANHEIGTLQPLGAIARLTRDHGAVVHTDLAQAAGKIRTDPADFDLGSVSAHKLGGPIGIGALVVKRSLRRRLKAVQQGGGQEGAFRAGTVPVALCVAFGEACRIADAELESDAIRVTKLRDELYASLAAAGGVVVHGGENRLPGNLNISFAQVDGEALILRVRDRVSLSTGSACTSHSLEPSHVLGAIGVVGPLAEGAIRIGLGRHTTVEEVREAASVIMAAVKDLRATIRNAA